VSRAAGTAATRAQAGFDGRCRGMIVITEQHPDITFEFGLTDLLQPIAHNVPRSRLSQISSIIRQTTAHSYFHRREFAHAAR
jgi:hypothetical protein